MIFINDLKVMCMDVVVHYLFRNWEARELLEECCDVMCFGYSLKKEAI